MALVEGIDVGKGGLTAMALSYRHCAPGENHPVADRFATRPGHNYLRPGLSPALQPARPLAPGEVAHQFALRSSVPR